MNKYTIFVSSSDAYSDIWDLFFDFFAKYWPEYDGKIVLNTELKEYRRDDLTIECTKVGNLGSFGKVLRAGLEKVETESILLIMIDYLFMGKVDDVKVKEYFNYFSNQNLDSLCLVWQGYPNFEPSSHEDLVKVIPPAPKIMFSYQIAFWKKEMLKEMALPHEDPWMSEWYGSKRAEVMKINLFSLKAEVERPFIYDLRGCLHKSRWLDNAIVFLNKMNYKVDLGKRGYYDSGNKSLKLKAQFKYKMLKTGLMGSYIDYYKRLIVKYGKDGYFIK